MNSCCMVTPCIIKCTECYTSTSNQPSVLWSDDYPMSVLFCVSFLSFFCHNVLVVSVVLVSQVPCHFCTVGHTHSSGDQFTLGSTLSQGLNFPDDVPLVPCYSCTVGHLAAGSSQPAPGSTISSCHLFWLSASPYS